MRSIGGTGFGGFPNLVIQVCGHTRKHASGRVVPLASAADDQASTLIRLGEPLAKGNGITYITAFAAIIIIGWLMTVPNRNLNAI